MFGWKVFVLPSEVIDDDVRKCDEEFSREEYDESDEYSLLISAVSNEENSVEELSTKPKRKSRPGRYKRLNPFLSIVKKDFRRQLPIMWMNVVNHNDPNVLRRFFHRICVGDSIHQSHNMSEIASLAPFVKMISSKDLTALQCAYKVTVSPDTCCKMISCQLKRVKDSDDTLIVMNLKMFGTLLYDIDTVKAQKCLGLPALVNANRDDFSLGDIDIKKLQLCTTLRENPLYMEIFGDFLVTVNKQKEVIKGEFFATSISCTTMPKPI